jgi:hypothetical protein
MNAFNSQTFFNSEKIIIFPFSLFLRQGVALYLRLTWNLLCSPCWPQICDHCPPTYISQVIDIQHHAQPKIMYFLQAIFLLIIFCFLPSLTFTRVQLKLPAYVNMCHVLFFVTLEPH